MLYYTLAILNCLSFTCFLVLCFTIFSPVFQCTDTVLTDGCRLKIFVPITILAFAVLVPVNWTNDTLEGMKTVHSDIDKLSISNIPNGSKRWAHSLFLLRFVCYSDRRLAWYIFHSLHAFYRFIAHLCMAYVITFWTCYVLKREYEIIANMRLHFLASEKRRPDQFTVRS